MWISATNAEVQESLYHVFRLHFWLQAPFHWTAKKFVILGLFAHRVTQGFRYSQTLVDTDYPWDIHFLIFMALQTLTSKMGIFYKPTYSPICLDVLVVGDQLSWSPKSPHLWNPFIPGKTRTIGMAMEESCHLSILCKYQIALDPWLGHRPLFPLPPAQGSLIFYPEDRWRPALLPTVPEHLAHTGNPFPSPFPCS